MKKRSRVVTALVAGILASAGLSLMASGPAAANPDTLTVCCAWNTSLGDNELTYTIAGGDATAQGHVNTAVQAWVSAIQPLNSATSDFTLTRVFTKSSDIEIRFKQGGGSIQGLTSWSFDRRGFITHVRISISGKAFGLPNNAALIDQITKHEMGHGLGLGHADFKDLMATTVSGGNSTISDCDLEGVLDAQDWRFVDDSATPSPPPSSSVAC
jgi:hypothetical protein